MKSKKALLRSQVQRECVRNVLEEVTLASTLLEPWRPGDPKSIGKAGANYPGYCMQLLRRGLVVWRSLSRDGCLLILMQWAKIDREGERENPVYRLYNSWSGWSFYMFSSALARMPTMQLTGFYKILSVKERTSDHSRWWTSCPEQFWSTVHTIMDTYMLVVYA